MIDMSALLNRIDKLEAKNDQHEVQIAELETKVAEHELKINSQQIEIDQLKQKKTKPIKKEKFRLGREQPSIDPSRC